MLERQRQLRAQQQQVKRASANKLPPGKKGGDLAKPAPKPPAGAPKALPPGNRGGALATRPTTSPAKPQPKPPAQRSSAIEKAGPTIDVKANTPKLGAGKPSTGGSAGGGVRAVGTALGRAGSAVGFLGTAAAAADQALRVFNPKDNLLTSLQQLGRSVSKATGDTSAPGGRPGYRQRGGPAPAKPRVSNIPPSEGTGRGGPSDVNRTQPKPPTRSSGGNPPAPGSIRRQSAPSSGGGGGSSAPSRPSRPSSPQTSTGTAGRGQQWADFNPNRGTSKSNNPLLDREGGFLRQRMKDREATQQAGDAQKLGNKFDTKSDLITPTTKVDGSNLDTKKIDQKKVDEYKRRKNRYYD